MNPDNYGSIEACKRLAEVLAKKGISVKTEVCWHIPENGEPELLSAFFLGSLQCFEGCKIIPAYSMPEVWRELPWYLSEYGTLEVTQVAETFACGYHKGLALREPLFTNTNPTDALIELWIWVLAQEE